MPCCAMFRTLQTSGKRVQGRDKERSAHQAQILAQPDDVVVAYFKANMPDNPAKQQIPAGGAAAVRSFLGGQAEDSTHFGGVQGTDARAAYELFGAASAPKVITLWRKRRQLPLPKAICKAGESPSESDPYALPKRVNPTVWPPGRPYHDPGGGGGLMMPFDCVNSYLDLPCLQARTAVRGTGAVHPALTVWAAAAAALRRLNAARALQARLHVPAYICDETAVSNASRRGNLCQHAFGGISLCGFVHTADAIGTRGHGAHAAMPLTQALDAERTKVLATPHTVMSRMRCRCTSMSVMSTQRWRA